MLISKIAVENYKSYLSRQDIELESGFNVIVGPNNSGKTALVDALSLSLENRPHLNLETVPTEGKPPSNSSRINVTFEILQNEFRQILRDNNWQTFFIKKYRQGNDESQKKKVEAAFLLPAIHIECTYEHKNIILSRVVEIDEPMDGDIICNQYTLNEKDDSQGLSQRNMNAANHQQLSYMIGEVMSKRIYYFQAERLKVYEDVIGTDPILKPDASNLAQVLHHLQSSNQARFNRLVELVKILFPDVKQIAVTQKQGTSNTVRIVLWNVEPSSEREDLAVPLEESGTGLGQVLAILYVVMTSPFPRPIIIDEPQSFLHPTVIRKLFEILRNDFSQHQYIMTTHSPLVVSAVKPEKIIILKKENTVTEARQVDISQADELRNLLAEVGARFSDVFGAENILWVEGKTEEDCFPMIVSEILDRPLLGTIILGVVNTGDFEGNQSERIFRIYRRLSEGGALLPPAIGFMFDKDGKTEKEQDDLIREGKGKVRFLPRRMYENYLIDEHAIEAVISKIKDFSEEPIKLENITDWINENRWQEVYFDNLNLLTSRDNETWLVNVKGDKFLEELFSCLSNERCRYDKVRHGIDLTKWIVDNSPEKLKELADELATLLS